VEGAAGAGSEGRVKLRRHIASLTAVALAAAVGVAALVDRGGISDRERNERDHDVFPAYRRGDIDSIEITHGKASFRIERRPDPGDAGDTHWQMTTPVDERADPAAVDRFIGDLEFAGAIRKVDPRTIQEVSKGFDDPEVRGTLSMKPLVYHFALGGPAPLPEGAAYFRVDGEGTYVVSKDFATSLRNGADAYREKSIVPYLSLDLASLEIQSGATTLTLTRVDEISFKIAKSGLRASRDGMDKIWGALAEAHAESFLSDGDADRAIGSSPIHVRMIPKDASKPRGEIAIGDTCPGHPEDVVLIRLSPTRKSACVPKGAVSGLLTPESSLIDHHLFASRADEVEEITFDRVPASFSVELARKGRGWHERKPQDRELAGSEVDSMNELVARLTRGDAVNVVAAGAPPSQERAFEPRARVRVKRAASSTDEVVELAGVDQVRRTFDGAILTVPSALGRELWPSEVAIRGRSVFPNALAGKLPAILSTDCDGVRQALARDGDHWVFRQPLGFRSDPLATADLVALIRNAQAESWVADEDDGTFGLAASHCRMQLDANADGGTTTLAIIFGRETEEGTTYAKTSTDHAVFLAPRGLREGATTWLLDRQVFNVDPATIDRVTLSRGSKHAVFNGRRAPGDGGVHDVVARVLSTFAVLRADAVLHVGAPTPGEGFGAPTLDVRVAFSSDAGPKELHFVFGDTAQVNRERLIYARVDGVDATFGIARERVTTLIDAF